MHRADTYVRKVSGECELLGVPLDASERSDLGSYVKNLIEKQGASPADLLRFSGHYATRRAENPKIRPSQAWADVAADDRNGGRGRRPDSIAVVGATQDAYEGDF